MNLQQYLYRRLADNPGVSALIGLDGSPADAKVFPIKAPQSGTRGKLPYVTVQRVGGAPDQDLGGPGGDDVRLQLTCRAGEADGASGLDNANLLADAVQACLDGLDDTVSGWGRITSLCILRLEQYDDAPKSYAVILDFSIFCP